MVKGKIDRLIKYLLKLYLAKFFSCNNEQCSKQNLDTSINSGFDQFDIGSLFSSVSKDNRTAPENLVRCKFVAANRTDDATY